MQRRPSRGWGGDRRHDDLQQHGQNLRGQARQLSIQHEKREAFLGVDPALVVVFELGASVDPDDLRRAGFRVVDSSDRMIIVAFADDPELAAFNDRLDALEDGIPNGQINEPYAQFFDSINNIRGLEAEDRITEELSREVDSAAADTVLRLDVECWHPGDAPMARQWLSDLSSGVVAAGGRVADSMIKDQAGLLLSRVYLPAVRVHDLAKLDIVARIDVLPTPALSVPEFFGLQADDLPVMQAPHDQAPVVGLVDSGVASAHEILARSVIASDALGAGIEDDQDEHGHGTMVASILLHGDLLGALRRGRPLRPICRIASARVLNANNDFSYDELWEHDLEKAIEWCVAQGATIINLSIGDDRYPFTPPRQMSAAAIVDEMIRTHGIVVVTATGNIHPLDYLPDVDSAATYPLHLIKSPKARIIDPGTSALALTVGGITSARAAGGLSPMETVGRVPLGEPGWPSPVTRVGPGPSRSVKPELIEHAGTLGVEHGQLVSNDPELAVVGARARAGRLLSHAVGTSFAVPMVSRVAAAVRARHPDFSGELVRALVLLSATRVPIGDDLLAGTSAQRRDGELALVGYGRPSLARAIQSTSHRAVLVAEQHIPIDGVHIYEVPLPSSFLASGGKRGIDIALAFSPRTRVRRLDYMATKMEFFLVKGKALEEVQRVFARLEGQELEEDESEVYPSMADGSVASDVGHVDVGDFTNDPPSPTGLRSSLISLDPPRTTRSRGANQVGRKIFHQRLRSERDSPLYVVVRSLNRWDDPDGEESYGLALGLWRSEDQGEIHAELEVELESVIEVPLEVEVEL